ncbi:MAG: hypothetical protein QNK19_01885 [Xanthomonadales bacterium]|nr:hypothetical protein [Xanthomonadales bacterium]
MRFRNIAAAFYAAVLVLAPVNSSAKESKLDSAGLDCRSYCAAPAGGTATLYASWPSLQKPDTRFRLYVTYGPESSEAKSDGFVIDMSRRKPKEQKLTRQLSKTQLARGTWRVKRKFMMPASTFADIKIGRVEVFSAPRGRNRADYAIAIDGLDPQTSYYLRLEGIKAKPTARSLDAYCAVTTCPGHDEGNHE